MRIFLSIALIGIVSSARAEVGLASTGWIDLSGHDAAVREAVWLPGGGKKLLTADWRGQIILWDVARGQKLASTNIGPGFVRSLAVFEDGKRFIACTNGQLVIGTTQPLAVQHSQKAPSYYFAVAVSPDGQSVAALVAGKHVDLFATRDGSPLGGFDLAETVETLLFLHDGRLVLPSTQSEFPTYNGLKPAEPLKLPGSVGRATDMAVSLDGKNLALTTRAELFVIPLTPGQSPLQISPGAGTLASLGWLGNTQIICGSDTGVLQRFDAAAGRKLEEWRLETGQCSAVAGSMDGNWIATGCGTYSDPQARPSRQMTGDNRVRVLSLRGDAPVIAAKNTTSSPAPSSPPPYPAYAVALEQEMLQAAAGQDLYLALLFKQERDLVLNRVALPPPAHDALRDLRARFSR